MIFVSRSKTLTRFSQQLLLNIRHAQSSSSVEESEIKIPARIHRGPTDILNALSTTVGTDPTASHFKYHDDPYLIPMSNIGKRTFALAQESGRKAAQWVRQQHSELFKHSLADPPIDAFAPKLVFTDDSTVDSNCLESLIRNCEVSDAAFVYKLLISNGTTISDELKQSLLELLCFYNNDNPLPKEFIEERWFKQGMIGKERQRKIWKDGELAEQIFNEIEPKSSTAYAAIIRGMCKYFQVDRAWALFQDAYEKQIELDTETFNSVISVASFLKESGEMRFELCQDLLKQMNDMKLNPNIGTLNAVMSVISSIGNSRLARTSAFKVLSEFKNYGIEPSLGTYYYLLAILCRDRGPVSHVLIDIMNIIEDKEFKIIHPKDIFFFVTAMDVCRNHLQDKNLAKRVNRLLHFGNNYDLIGDSYKESIYYRHYFGLLCETEPLEVFMETYDLLVPNIYTPEPGIMEEVLKAIDINGALELVPRIWSDMIIFDHINRESLLNKILKIIIDNKIDETIPTHEGLRERFATIGWDIYTKINELTEKRNQKLSFTGQILGDILTVLVRAGDMEKANQVFNKIDKNQHQIPGTPSPNSLSEFIDLCIIEKSPTLAINCLQYCVENGMDGMPLAKKINNGFTLNETHMSKIKDLLGEDCFIDKDDKNIK